MSELVRDRRSGGNLKRFVRPAFSLFFSIVLILQIAPSAFAQTIPPRPRPLAYVMPNSSVELIIQRSVDARQGEEGTLHVSRGNRAYDTRQPASLVLPTGVIATPNKSVVELTTPFAVFQGQNNVTIALASGKLVVEQTDLMGTTVEAKVDLASDGRTGLVRGYRKRTGSDEAPALWFAAVISDGQVFACRGAESAVALRALEEAEKEPNKIIQAYVDALKEDARQYGEPRMFSRIQHRGFDLSSSKAADRLQNPLVFENFDFEGPLPAQFSGALGPSANPRKPSATGIVRRPPNDSVKVKDERGKDVPAIDGVKGFARDLLQVALKEGWTYDEVPALRALEDRIFKSWLMPEGGSVKLLGPSGAGKDFLIQRIAVRLLRGDCPEPLKNKNFWEFNAGGLVAGTSLRGQTEARMLAVVALSEPGDMLWSVSEAHSLAGAGTSLHDSNDVLQIAKPSLSSGRMKWIAQSTPDEWNREIAKDTALDRRFTRVDYNELSGDTLRQVVRSHWKRFGAGALSDEVVENMIALADQYAFSGAQPSRTTQLSNSLVAQRLIDRSKGDPSLVEAQREAIELWSIPRETFDPALRLQSHDQLEKLLEENIVGQSGPKKAVLQQDRNLLARVRDQKLPGYRLIFLGPKGTGKSEMSDLISQSKSGQPAMRIMLSEYKTAKQVSELKQAIADYQNRAPDGVLVVDEAEKGHEAAQDMFLGVWDRGELTIPNESAGTVVSTRVIRLRRMQVIAIANAASDFILKLAANNGHALTIGFGREESAAAAGRVDGLSIQTEAALRKAAEADGFNPYLLDRSEDIAVFYPPTENEFLDVIRLHVRKAKRQIQQQAGLEVVIENEEDMVRDLASAYFQKNGSNREAVRAVSRAVRNSAANARFALEREAIVQGQTGFTASRAPLRWAGGSLELDAEAASRDPGSSACASFAFE